MEGEVSTDLMLAPPCCLESYRSLRPPPRSWWSPVPPLQQPTPAPQQVVSPPTAGGDSKVRCRQRLGGARRHRGQFGMDDEKLDPSTGLWECFYSKGLTDSDVSLLNRHVISCKSTRCLVADTPGQQVTKDSEEILQKFLRFTDEKGRFWEFLFKFDRRRKSAVLTTNWSKFVDEYLLRNGDEVRFYSNRENHKLGISCVRQRDGDGV